MTFSLSLINSLLLPFCILTVLNFWQTSRNTTLSCQAPVAFSPPATLELSGSATPAPRHLALLLRLGLEGVRQRQRHSRRGFPQINSPQPSSPTWCLLNSVTPPPPLWQASWLPRLQKKTRTLSSSSTSCPGKD